MTEPSQHTLALGAPAASFYEALLLGDGHLGAAVHGLVGAERIELNLDTFWSGGPLPLPRDPEQPGRAWLEPLREAVRQRRWRRADELAGHLQGQGWAQSYQPLGALLVRYSPDPGGAPVQHYARRLEMADAVAITTYGSADVRTEVTAFVSAAHGVLVVDVHEPAAPARPVELDLDSPHRTTAATLTPTGPGGEPLSVLTWAGRAPADVLPDYFGDVDGAVTYADDDPDDDGLVDAGMGFAVAALVQPTPTGRRVLVAAADGFRGRRERPSADVDALRARAAHMVAAAAGTSTQQLRVDHSADHRRWFATMDLVLSEATAPDTAPDNADVTGHGGAPPHVVASPRPGARSGDRDGSPDEATGTGEDAHPRSVVAPGVVGHHDTSPAPEGHPASAADVARFFHLGRYLLIASSRPGTQPANLQGIWNTDVRPGWGCGWTTNINLQMNYWPAGPTGLGELAGPMHRLIEDLAADPLGSAAAYYGAEAGWVVHHNTDLWGFSAPVEGKDPVNPACTNWPAATLWLATHYATSRTYAEPATTVPAADAAAAAVLLGAAELTLTLLEPHPDGRLVTNPSTSPEHLFLDADGTPRAVSAGAAMDQQLAAEVLAAAVDLLDALPDGSPTEGADLRRRAAAALDALRPPQVGVAGDLLEWADDRAVQDRGHRHVSHLYGLYPGHSIDERRTPELFAAARVALRGRLDHGGGGTGWSQAWILCLAARLGEADLVQRCLDVLVHDLSSAALLDLHPVPDHASGYRFQIDGNLGAAAGVLEALVHSVPGEVRLLPALPRRWASGKITGVRTYDGHRVDLRWDGGDLRRAVLTAGRASTTAVYYPADRDLQVLGMGGTSLRTAGITSAGSDLPGYSRVEWAARPGESLEVRRAEP